MIKYLPGLFTLFLSLHFTQAVAQWGYPDPSFNPTDVGYGNGDGLNNGVNDILIQPDGKVILLSASIWYNGYISRNMVRTNADGTIDSTFVSPFLQPASFMNGALQADGKIIVGGGFSLYPTNPQGNIIRLLPDGTPDSTFQFGTGFTGTVFNIIVQPDGKILTAGSFNNYNGSAVNGLTRLLPNGSLDTTFNIAGISPNMTIYDIELQPDGKIVAAGDFSINSTYTQGVVRFLPNGTLDTTFITLPASHQLNCVALQADGKVVVGGTFTSYNSAPAGRIIRLNPNGTIDTSFNTGAGFSNSVLDIVVQPDSNIVVSGSFDYYQSTLTRNLVRLSATGVLETSYCPDKVYGHTVVLALQPDGKLLLGGTFSRVGFVFRQSVARLNTNGTLDLSYNAGSGFDGVVRKIAVQQDGKIIATGEFTLYNGVPNNSIIRLLPNGGIDSTFITGTGLTNQTSAGGVMCLLLQPDGKIVIGGYFSEYNGTSVTKLIRLNANGSLDNTFYAAVSTYPNCIAYEPGGTILVGYNNGMSRLTSTGSTAAFSPPSFNNSINAIAPGPGGSIYVGGNFTSVGGVTRNRLVKLNSTGTVNSSFMLGSGFNNKVTSLAVQADGKILVGGNGFTSYNGTSRNNLIRLNTNGTVDNTFVPAIASSVGFTPYVKEILIQGDKKIIIAGLIPLYGNDTTTGVIRLDTLGAMDTTFMSVTGIQNSPGYHEPWDISLQNGQNLIIGGSLKAYHGMGRNRLVRVNNCVNTEMVMNVQSCSSYSFNGQTYTTPGTYYQYLTNARGCDSTIVINLSNPVFIGDTLTVNTCQSFTAPSGNYTWTSSGMYTDTLTTVNGCDSVVPVVLTILTPTTSAMSPVACNSYISPTGNLYTATGTYTDTLINTNGCDSVITINLTVNNTSYAFQNISSCNSYTSPSGNFTWTSSGSYNDTIPSSAGCDSVININLSLTFNSSAIISTSACGIYTVPSGTAIYTQSGVYTDTLINSQGCDSILTINLVVIDTVYTPVNISHCGTNYQSPSGNYNWTSSGFYLDTLQAMSGCDSILQVNLTLVNLNASTSLTGTVLTAQPNGASYRWLDCSNGFTAIPGAGNQIFTPSANGSYAVEVSKSGCVDTSACRAVTGVGIMESSPEEISVFPNPSSGTVTLVHPSGVGGVLEIFDLTGRLIQEMTVISPSTSFELSGSAGIYFLRFKKKNASLIIRLVKI